MAKRKNYKLEDDRITPESLSNSSEEVAEAESDRITPVEKKEAKPRQAVSTSGVKTVDKLALDTANIIAKKLSKEPQVRIILSLKKGEKKGDPQVVIIGGYRMAVPKGIMINVPESVALILQEREGVDYLGDDMKIGRDDKTENALS